VEVVWIYVVWDVGMYAETALAPPHKIRIFILKNMMFILYYLLIGIIIMFLLDMHLSAYRDKIENDMGEKIEYDHFTRIFIIVVWPAAIFIILKNFPWGR
jgi:ABC-type lipoprotein release transport system permease subunit